VCSSDLVSKIVALLDRWIDWNPRIGGRATCSQGAFNIGENVRMPDVAYTPRDTDRNLFQDQIWTYHGEPFAPTFVVEVDTLSGQHSQLDALDYKMRHEYFQHGIELGWLIDPENKIMYVYKLRGGNVMRVRDRSWRNLSGENVLPGFVLE
jgi:Uma2 family endonuclease